VRQVIFDLDGVITDTARIHARAWKRMFDQLLLQQDAGARLFDLDVDYANYIDGRSRLQGIRDFLASRSILLPLGNPEDVGFDSMHGVGNVKNDVFVELVRVEGIACFADALNLLQALTAQKIPIGLATSSKNSALVLQATQLAHYFSVVVDGNDIERLGLMSKPSPDIFIEACRRMAGDMRDMVIVEDALSGVCAARAAGPWSVIGVNRRDNEHGKALQRAGADQVVEDMTALIAVL
jgi:trehalose 6-phosphate phosphatase